MTEAPITTQAGNRPVAICFDPDDAGRTAADQLADTLKTHSRHGWIITPPQGQDLETWLAAEPESLTRLWQGRHTTRETILR